MDVFLDMSQIVVVFQINSIDLSFLCWSMCFIDQNQFLSPQNQINCTLVSS